MDFNNTTAHLSIYYLLEFNKAYSEAILLPHTKTRGIGMFRLKPQDRHDRHNLFDRAQISLCEAVLLRENWKKKYDIAIASVRSIIKQLHRDKDMTVM